MATQIGEIAQTVGFTGGTPSHRLAEPSSVQTLPVIDNSLPNQPNVRTSVDCYVSGQYVQRNGKVMEVTQRYTIYVAYAHSTQMQTMSQVRDRIVGDFEARYGRTFNVTNAFVPGLPVPKPQVPGVAPGQTVPMELYGGTDMFREMSRYEKARYEVGGEHLKEETNIRNIRKRYGLKR